jgi:hypothetical protein
MEPQEVIAALGAPVYRPTAPGPIRRESGYGWSGSPGGPFTISLRYAIGNRGDWIEVKTTQEETREGVLVALSILGKDVRLDARRLRFPLTSTVEKTDVLIPVDGEPRTFAAYLCGRESVAVARLDDRWVYLTGRRHLLKKLALGAERPSDLRKFLERSRVRSEKRRAMAHSIVRSLSDQ